MSYFYLSFCDPGRPKGQQFLGATVVDADGPEGAIARARVLGVNPGGEVAIVDLGDEVPETGRCYIDRFVPREVVLAEAHMPLADVLALGEEDEDLRMATVCADCNDV